MKKIIKNLLRLFWYLPYRLLRFLCLGTVLSVPHGWDTLYPLAPCSEGGILRNNFKMFLKMDTETLRNQFEDVKWGKHRELFLTVTDRQELLKSWWPS